MPGLLLLLCLLALLLAVWHRVGTKQPRRAVLMVAPAIPVQCAEGMFRAAAEELLPKYGYVAVYYAAENDEVGQILTRLAAAYRLDVLDRAAALHLWRLGRADFWRLGRDGGISCIVRQGA